MVKLGHRDQAVVERLHAEALHREAKGGMGADQHLVITFKERADAVDLAAILAGCVAQVPFRGNGPVGPEAELGQRLVGKAGTDAFFRHDDDGLANALEIGRASCRERVWPDVLISWVAGTLKKK